MTLQSLFIIFNFFKNQVRKLYKYCFEFINNYKYKEYLNISKYTEFTYNIFLKIK